jgi:surface antigen
MRRSLAVPMLLAMIATASGGHAQGFLPLVRDLGLNNDDYRIATAEAATLYESGPIEVGADSIWQNPDTGSHGKVEVIAFDGRCVTLEHVFRSGRTANTNRVTARRCKGEDGVWRLAAE